jgi:flagellar protein FlaG
MSIQSLNNNAAAAIAPAVAQSGVPVAATNSTEPPKETSVPPPPSQKQLEAAVKEVARIVQPKASNLDFAIDKDSGKTIVRITDRQTGEMIRQIPSEEMVDLARNLDRMQGMLMKQKA